VDEPRGSDTGRDYRSNNEDDWYSEYDLGPTRKRNRERSRSRIAKPPRQSATSLRQNTERVESRDGTFRCRQCKTIVGPPISGGRHRNHCPLCLYSRHVDRSMPGDRAAECRSMMTPAGVFTRRDGEQMLLHICGGCGVKRRNRIAADDNAVSLMRLPVVDANAGEDAGTEESIERSA
jgi:hypothetical protein